MKPQQTNKIARTVCAKPLRFARALALLSLPVGAFAQEAETPTRELDPMVITSQAEIQAISLERYRESDALKNVISADEIGQFVDQNVAESLHRLPGVSITRDQGEGRFVSIRGIEPALNTTSVNGMRIGTPEDGNRNIPLDIIPSGTAQILEITKVPTPDMPGDSIGGAINISTKSAFERDGREINYRLMGTYSELTGDIGPNLKVGYSDLLSIFGGEDNFGISFGISYQDRDFGSDNIETEYEINNDLGSNVIAPKETDLRQYMINRERLGLSLDLDFSPSDGNEFFLNTVFAQFTDAETRQLNRFGWGRGNLNRVTNGTFEFDGIQDRRIERRIRFRTQEQEVFALSTGGRHELDNWNIDYLLGFSKATEDAPDEIQGRFVRSADGNDNGASVNAGSGIPTFSITNGGLADSTYLSNENFELRRVNLEEKYTEETTQNFAINFERLADSDSHLPKLKFGFDARLTQKNVDVEERTLRKITPGAVSLADFTSSRRSFPFNDLGDGISSSAFRNYFYAKRIEFAEAGDAGENTILSTVEDFEADEDVYAGYLMGTWDWSDWRLIAGARVERTDFSADGFQVGVDENDKLQSLAVKGSSKYTNFLPGLHLRYEGFNNMVIRGAWSNTIGRPNFDDLAPNAEINTPDRKVSAGNPDLDPYEASNLDLMVDYYLPGAGIFSAGVFYKKIDNYIVDFTTTTDPEFVGFEVERAINGDDAHVFGLELNWEQQLGEWTSVLGGFLIGANATFLDTEFEINKRPGETFQLPRASEEVFNLYIGYERGRFSGRLSSNWRSEFLEELGDSKDFDIYVANHNQWDLTLAYRIRPGIEIVAEIANITDEPLEVYQGSKGNNFQFEEYGTTFNLGVKGSF